MTYLYTPVCFAAPPRGIQGNPIVSLLSEFTDLLSASSLFSRDARSATFLCPARGALMGMEEKPAESVTHTLTHTHTDTHSHTHTLTHSHTHTLTHSHSHHQLRCRYDEGGGRDEAHGARKRGGYAFTRHRNHRSVLVDHGRVLLGPTIGSPWPHCLLHHASPRMRKASGRFAP